MKRVLSLIAGFAIVTACSIAAILTAQERRYESKLANPNVASQANIQDAAQEGLFLTRTLGTTVTAVPSAGFFQATVDSVGHKLNVEIRQAQQALAAATTDEQRAEAQSKLREVLSAQFDADMKRRQTELENIHKRLTEMTAVLEKRTAAKESIVELRLQVISQDANGLGWSDSNDRNWLTRADSPLGPAALGPATFEPASIDGAGTLPDVRVLERGLPADASPLGR